MTDKFIDDLYNRLHAEQQQQLMAAAKADRHQQRLQVLVDRWWAEFVDVLGQKVGAWNEKGVPGGQVNFTKRPSGGAHLWHASVEIEFRLDGHQVKSNAGFGASPRHEGTFVELHDPGDGPIVAMCEGEPLESPTAAAEKALTPILTQAFAQR